MQLNIRDFYLSISEETLDKAISFTLNQTTVSVEDIRIIKHSQKLLLQAWKKKKSSSCFDVTMYRYDETELCELVQVFTQSVLQDIRKGDNGWYRGAVAWWLSLLHNFIQQSLNLGSFQVHILLPSCQEFAMVRISDIGPGWK